MGYFATKQTIRRYGTDRKMVDRQIYIAQSKAMILMYNQMATFCVNECILAKWQQSNVFNGLLSSDILRHLIKV